MLVYCALPMAILHIVAIVNLSKEQFCRCLTAFHTFARVYTHTTDASCSRSARLSWCFLLSRWVGLRTTLWVGANCHGGFNAFYSALGSLARALLVDKLLNRLVALMYISSCFTPCLSPRRKLRSCESRLSSLSRAYLSARYLGQVKR
jgi:hypothetical protein